MINGVRQGVRVFPVRMPSGARYWTLLAEDLEPVAEADGFLRHLRFGRDAAESTTCTYAGALALFLRWCAVSGRDWRTAAGHLGMSMLWLRHDGGSAVAAGPGVRPVRGSRRVNTVLAAVREFLKYHVSNGSLPPTGLRRSEAAGLRRQDLHFVVDATMLGCPVQGAHLHVVRRENANGAWAKSRRSGVIPADFLVVQAYDAYVVERERCPQAGASDFVLVNLFRGQVGRPMPPGALNELLERLSRRAGLGRVVHPHQLRHAFGSAVMDAGGTLDEAQHLLRHASISSTQVYPAPLPAAPAGSGRAG